MRSFTLPKVSGSVFHWSAAEWPCQISLFITTSVLFSGWTRDRQGKREWKYRLGQGAGETKISRMLNVCVCACVCFVFCFFRIVDFSIRVHRRHTSLLMWHEASTKAILFCCKIQSPFLFFPYGKASAQNRCNTKA